MKFTEQELEEMRLADAEIEAEEDKFDPDFYLLDKELDAQAKTQFLTDRERRERERYKKREKRSNPPASESDGQKTPQQIAAEEKILSYLRYGQKALRPGTSKQRPPRKKKEKPQLTPEEEAEKKARIRERKKEIDAYYRATHKEQRKACNKAWRERNADHVKAYADQYNKTHVEENRTRAKAYREAHIEECRARSRAYKETHREQFREYQARYVSNNPEKVKAQQEAWRAAKQAERDIKSQFVKGLYEEGQITASQIWEMADAGEITKTSAKQICGPRVQNGRNVYAS